MEKQQWFKIEGYSYMHYTDWTSDVFKCDGYHIIFAATTPFSVEINFQNSKRTLHLVTGDYCFIAPGVEHHFYTNIGLPTKILTLELSVTPKKEGCYHTIENLIYSQPAVEKLLNGRPYYIIASSKKFVEMLLLLQHFHEKSIREKNNTRVLDPLIATILTQAAEDAFASLQKPMLCVHIRKAIGYITKNYRSHISLEELSDFVGVGSRRMQILFKEELETTFNDFLNNFRINKACDLLRSTDMSIEDIAFETGYNSRQHFILTFKKYTEMTPNQYRKYPLRRNYKFQYHDENDVFYSTMNDVMGRI